MAAILEPIYQLLLTFWAGATITIAVFIVRGPATYTNEDGRYFGQLMSRRRLALTIGATSLATLMTGALLQGPAVADALHRGAVSMSVATAVAGLLAGFLTILLNLVFGLPIGTRLRRWRAAVEHSHELPSPESIADHNRWVGQIALMWRCSACLLAVAVAAAAITPLTAGA
jgi:hypothetical protein